MPYDHFHPHPTLPTLPHPHPIDIAIATAIAIAIALPLPVGRSVGRSVARLIEGAEGAIQIRIIWENRMVRGLRHCLVTVNRRLRS